MDDREMSPGETPPQGGSSGFRYRLGPAASLFLVGLLAGLAIGWIAWRGETIPGSSASAGELLGSGAAVMVEGVDVSNDPVLGDAGAVVTIVEFSDFECPFCKRFAQQTAPLLRRQYGESIRWIFVNNPLQSIHPKAYDIAIAGECAHEQERFWDFYDAMFSGQFGTSDEDVTSAARSIGLDTDRFGACYRDRDHAAEVAADLKEAQKFYIFGTPTFFINGQRLEGAQPPEAFAAIIDPLLHQ